LALTWGAAGRSRSGAAPASAAWAAKGAVRQTEEGPDGAGIKQSGNYPDTILMTIFQSVNKRFAGRPWRQPGHSGLCWGPVFGPQGRPWPRPGKRPLAGGIGQPPRPVPARPGQPHPYPPSVPAKRPPSGRDRRRPWRRLHGRCGCGALAKISGGSNEWRGGNWEGGERKRAAGGGNTITWAVGVRPGSPRPSRRGPAGTSSGRWLRTRRQARPEHYRVVQHRRQLGERHSIGLDPNWRLAAPSQHGWRRWQLRQIFCLNIAH
jgi:hypothetical protein